MDVRSSVNLKTFLFKGQSWYCTWRWLVHEVELQPLLGLLGEERLVVIQLLLTVILRPMKKKKIVKLRLKITKRGSGSANF